MTAPLSFEVIGTPAAQGSKRHVGHGILIEQSRAVTPWRQAVAHAARGAMLRHDCAGFPTGPVRLHITFRIRPPKYLPKRVYVWPWRRPDLDKMLRSTFDGLSESGVWHDDAQVVTVLAGKRYAALGQPTGASVTIAAERAAQIEWEAVQ